QSVKGLMYLPINYQFRFCKSAAKINFYFETCKKIGEKFRKSCWQGENVYKCAKNIRKMKRLQITISVITVLF
ncbi:hypothetical protein CWC20_21380, partial [Pseudoalteromonas aurantia]